MTILARTLTAVTLLLVTTAAMAQLETRYGHVVAKQQIDQGNSIPAGAVIGGIVGLATAGGKSSSTKAKRTAGGALLGGVIGNQVDKSKRQWLYTVRFPGGDEERIMLDDDRLNLGDCAAVTYSTYETTVGYTSNYFCQPGSGRRGPGPAATTTVAAEDDPCLEAKRRLLDATDEDEIAQLERKVELICN